MKARVCLWLLLVVGVSGGSGIAAADTGWMQPGVRLWYLGGVGGGDTSSNAEEAYLIDAVVGTNARVVHHSALTHWTAPLPVETTTSLLLDQGPCWIHPQRLQTIAPGDYWRDPDQIITLVERPTYTYTTFVNNVLPAKVHLLPIKALFDLKPTRQMVKLVYMIDQFSEGSAYFDADTGIVLYHNEVWGANKMFFILAEINYDFARQAAFAEEGGPHTGFRSFFSEGSLGSTWGVGGGSLVIQSLVETRYGAAVEARVLTSISGPKGLKMGDENYCFFGDVPIVRRMDATQAPNYLPEQWNPFGQYLWWWLPPTAMGAQTINVFDVPMVKTSDQPLTYTATEDPQRFFFTTLWFGTDGYVTAFAAKDTTPDATTTGFDVKPGDIAFQNSISVDGLDYYRTVIAPRPSDFNGDGRPDILWRNAVTGQNVLWLMDGATWLGQASLPTVADPQWQIAATADLNGDGKPDLVWRNATTGQNVVWYLDGTTFVSQALLPTVADTAWQIVAAADFNADGKPDLVWRNRATGQNVVWYLNGATLVSQGLLPPVADPQWQIEGAADFNGDGTPDLLWRHATTGQNAVWYMNGATFLSQALLPTVADTSWHIGLVADFNGDGRVDIMWRNGATGQNVVWYLDGVTFVSQALLPPESDGRWELAGARTPPAAAVSDFNGDGSSDLVWRNSSTGQNVVWYMSGTTFLSQVALPPVADTNWQIVASADFNWDGQPDLVWRNATTGQNVAWYMNGATFVSQAVLPTVADTNWQIVAAADFNGDGQPDLVWRNAVTGQNVVWYMSGATFVSQAVLPTVADTNWQIVAAADFNADGQPDLVWRNGTTGQNVVWYLNGTTFVSQALLPTVPDRNWQIAMAADFNGDHKSDLVWRNVTTGQNVVWLLDGVTFLGQTLLPSVADPNWMILRDKR